jgi:hypothetical protein
VTSIGSAFVRSVYYFDVGENLIEVGFEDPGEDDSPVLIKDGGVTLPVQVCDLPKLIDALKVFVKKGATP